MGVLHIFEHRVLAGIGAAHVVARSVAVTADECALSLLEGGVVLCAVYQSGFGERYSHPQLDGEAGYLTRNGDVGVFRLIAPETLLNVLSGCES